MFCCTCTKSAFLIGSTHRTGHGRAGVYRPGRHAAGSKQHAVDLLRVWAGRHLLSFCRRGTLFVFAQVDEDSVYRVCDQPHPKHVYEMLQLCCRGEIDQAAELLRNTLWQRGYAAVDIIVTMFNVCQTLPVCMNSRFPSSHNRLRLPRFVRPRPPLFAIEPWRARAPHGPSQHGVRALKTPRRGWGEIAHKRPHCI